MANAVSAASMVSALGVNTHLDFGAYGYQNLSTVEAAINYLGIKTLRDSPESAADVGASGSWQQIAAATGAKFDAYIPEGSPAQMAASLTLMKELASQHILSAMEGGNEEDDPYAIQSGNSLSYTAGFQSQVYQAAHAAGLPAINMSFGQGWTSANNWQGDYGTVGNLDAVTDYANGHVYPGTAGPMSGLQLIQTDAALTAPGKPLIDTEFGYDTSVVSQATAAAYSLDGIFDAQKLGITGLYFYALFNDASGNFGLMNSNGTPTAAGTAVHDLTTLLADPGATASFKPGSLAYTLTSSTGDNSFLMQKSDGSYWIAVWNENAGAHTDTLTLPGAAKISVFNPLTGTAAVSLTSGTAVNLSLSNAPLLVEVQSAAAAGTATSTGSQGAASDPPPPTTTSTSGQAASPDDTVISVPSTLSGSAGQPIPLAGVSVSDPWAAATPGTLAVNLWASAGSVTIGGHTYAGGTAVPAGGMFSGTLAQVNAALAGASFTGSTAGTDTVTVDIWNQAGVETDKTLSVSVKPTMPVVTLGAAQGQVVTASNSEVVGTGTHVVLLEGKCDLLKLSGGDQDVMAFGSGNTIQISGGDNIITEGSGGNTIDMPSPGSFDDLWGNISADKLDFTSALETTAWNGSASTLSQFIHVSASGGNTTVSLSKTPNGAMSAVATIHGESLSMAQLMPQSLT